MSTQHIYEKDLLDIYHRSRLDEEGFNALEKLLRIDKLSCLEMTVELSINKRVETDWYFSLCVMLTELYRYMEIDLSNFDYIYEIYLEQTIMLSQVVEEEKETLSLEKKVQRVKNYLVLRKELIKHISALTSRERTGKTERA